MPGGSTGEAIPLQQHSIPDTQLGQMVECIAANTPTTFDETKQYTLMDHLDYTYTIWMCT